ncbi:MAG: DoxX family protein [Aequorivita sp.]|nr:DoxX family protein [Aequorivita sp.]|tara:strand:+ start:17304 stop:18401 length:1098 start_codon:yes stop_codon:yes gene_type:complete
MKILVGISRFIVGVLFIISGLIKLNDPVGFSFKLKDYFAPEVLDLQFLVPFALLIAIFVVIFEVLVGIALLLGYLRRFTLWSLLLMIVFFTFLTFYSAYFNKVTDCGCFGDAIKLTPWESFTKDVVLLFFILILFFGKKYIQPFFTREIRSILIFASFIGCLAITYYVLLHLPIIDFRPYKVGANISEGMSVPEDAPGPLYDYHWTFNINGEEKTITTNGDYPQVDGELINTETEMIQEGYTPPIHDFSIERDGEDFTTQFLEEEKLVVIVAYSLGNTEKEGFVPIKKITDDAIAKGYRVIGLSASSQEMTGLLVERYNLDFKFYFCDETTLKTIVRSNPGILELNRGTIKQKLHWGDAHKFKLP